MSAFPSSPLLVRRTVVLETVARLQQDFIRGGLTADALATMLRRVLDLTDSGVGFVARLVDTGAGADDAAAGFDAGFDAGLDAVLDVEACVGVDGTTTPSLRLGPDGPWSVVVRTLEPVITSWPTTAPLETGWSVPLVTFLGLPLLGDRGVVGVLAIANREDGYHDEWLGLLLPVCTALAPMFESQRQRAREALLEGEVHRWADMFAAAIESTGVSVITTDLRGTVEYLNPTAQRLLGVTVGDKRAALNLAAFHDPAELARAADEAARLHLPCASPFDAVVARARARDGVDRRDWTWVSLAGVRAPMMVTSSALRDRAGSPTGWVIVGNDLTELRAAEAERVRAAALEAQLSALRRRELETAKVSEAYEYVSASRSLREALHVIGAFLPSIFGELPPQLLVQRAPTRSDVDGTANVANDDHDDHDDGGALRAIEQRDCWSLKTGQRFVSEAHGLRCAHLPGDGRAWVCTPLADGGGTVAVLSAPLSAAAAPSASPSTGPAPRGDTAEEAQRRAASLSDLARQLSSVLANLRLRKTLEEQATHDPLTGAVNRRQLEAELKLTVHRHEKTAEPFAVLVVDVDHFKRINDAFGHERGDRVLSGLGTLLRKRLRASDVLARVGGEEFVVLLRAVDRATTETLAESFRAAVEAAQLAGSDVFCTCSIGAVHVARLEVGVDELLRRADRALYEAKATGRNRVVFSDAGAPRALRELA